MATYYQLLVANGVPPKQALQISQQRETEARAVRKSTPTPTGYRARVQQQLSQARAAASAAAAAAARARAQQQARIRAEQQAQLRRIQAINARARETFAYLKGNTEQAELRVLQARKAASLGDRGTVTQTKGVLASTARKQGAARKQFPRVQQRQLKSLALALKKLNPKQADPWKTFENLTHAQQAALMRQYPYAIPAITEEVQSVSRLINERLLSERGEAAGAGGATGVLTDVLDALNFLQRNWGKYPERQGVFLGAIREGRVKVEDVWNALPLDKRAQFVREVLGRSVSPEQTEGDERLLAEIKTRITRELRSPKLAQDEATAARMHPNVAEGFRNLALREASPTGLKLVRYLATSDAAAQRFQKAHGIRLFTEGIAGGIISDPLMFTGIGGLATRGLKTTAQITNFLASKTGARTIRTFATEVMRRSGNYRAVKALLPHADDAFVARVAAAKSIEHADELLRAGMKQGKWAPTRTRTGFIAQQAERLGVDLGRQGFRRGLIQSATRGRASLTKIGAIGDELIDESIPEAAIALKHGLKTADVRQLRAGLAIARQLGTDDTALRRMARTAVAQSLRKSSATGARGLRRIAQPENTRVKTTLYKERAATVRARKKLPGLLNDIGEANAVIDELEKTSDVFYRVGQHAVTDLSKKAGKKKGLALTAKAERNLDLGVGVTGRPLPLSTKHKAALVAKNPNYAIYGQQARKIAAAEVAAVAAGVASREMRERVLSLPKALRRGLLLDALKPGPQGLKHHPADEVRAILADRIDRITGTHTELLATKRTLEDALKLPKRIKTEIEQLRQPFGARALAKVFHFIDSIHGAVPPTMLPYERSAEAALGISRAARALHLGAELEDDLANAMYRASKHGLDAAKNVRNRLIRHAGAKHGLNAKQQAQLVTRVLNEEKKFLNELGVYSGSGERKLLIKEQLQRAIFIPDPTLLSSAIREMKGKVLATSAVKRAGLATSSKALKAVSKVRRAQSTWKFFILTGLGTLGGAIGVIPGGAIGAVVGAGRAGLTLSKGALLRRGAATIEGHEPINTMRGLARSQLERSFKGGAAAGAAVGSVVTGLRYIWRVPVIEETLRSVAVQGSGRAFISRLPLGLGDRLLLPKGLTADERALIKQQYKNRVVDVLSHDEQNWARSGRFKRSGKPGVIDLWDERVPLRERVEALGHILNNQIRDDDPVLSLLTKARFGTDEEKQLARKEVRRWLTTEPEGITYANNLMKSVGHMKTVDDIIDNAQKLIDEVVTHPAMVLERKAGMVSEATLKRLIQSREAPRLIHGTPKEYLIPIIGKNARVVAGHYILQAPTNVLSRMPFFRAEYIENIKNLLAEGVPLEQAVKRAADLAVETTNEIMFRLDGTSRFARQLDLISPFQQVREELPRVYGKIVRQHPGRVLRMQRVGSAAMSDLKQRGLVYEDANGNLVMRVPGSAWLSRMFGGPNHEFEFHLNNLSFIGAGIGFGMIPTPGGVLLGPVMSFIVNANPNLFPKTKWMQEWLFPFGSNFQFVPRQYKAIWSTIFNTTPPWQVIGKDAEEKQLADFRLRVARNYLWELGEARQGVPSEEEFNREVNERTKQLLLAQAAFLAVWPAASQPVFPGKEDFDTVSRMSRYKMPNGQLNIQLMLTEHPELQAYVTVGRKTDGATGEARFEGPEEFWHELQNRDYDQRARLLNAKYFKTADLKEFHQSFVKAQELNAKFNEWQQILMDPDKRRKNMRLATFNAKHPEVRATFDRAEMRDNEYADARATFDPVLREKLLNEWRFKWKVKPQEEVRLSSRYAIGRIGYNVWQEAREPADIYTDYLNERNERNGSLSIDEYLAGKSPAEAVKLYQWMQMKEDKAEVRNAKGEIIGGAKLWSLKIGEVYKNFPELIKHNPTNPFQEMYRQEFLKKYRLQDPNKIEAKYYKTNAALLTRIDQLKKAMDRAAKAKNWKVFWSLHRQRARLYAERDALQTAVFAKYPDWDAYAQTFKDGWFDPNLTPQKMAALNAEGYGFLVLSSDQKLWEVMSDKARASWPQELKDFLDSNKKFKFEWLSPFERFIFESTWGHELTRKYARGIGRGGSGRGGRRGGIHAELGWAYEMFKQFSKRAPFAQAPAAYEQYRKLTNPAEKREFLRRHPEVAAWIKSGPMANMPPIVRLMVSNIMLRSGKWDFNGQGIDASTLSYNDMTEIAWAQLQLERFNRRGDQIAPSSLDVWMKMPSGAAKAEYLRKHPELKAWFQAGPMASMPDNIRDIVRDIMVNFGLWTEKQDPLSKLLTEYHKLPDGARSAFLEKHPEIVEYWRAITPPEEQHLFDLQQEYFATQDPAERRMFLESHPELQEYFVTLRERRYERFLNRVAFFLGSNPELFQNYLEDQTTTLKLLLDRFGERPLVVEQVVTRSMNRRAS